MTASTGPGRRRWAPAGLSAYRPLLLTLLFALFVLLLVQTGRYSREQALADLQQRADTHLDRYILSLQQKLDRYKDLPQLLTTHSDLTEALSSADPEAVARANRYLESVNTIVGTTDAYLMDADGVTVAASNWQDPATFIGRNFNFRPYFQDAMRGLAGRYFALGTTSNKRGYYFSYPVYAAEQVAGVVVVKIDLHDVEQHWSNPEIDLLVTDEDSVIFISTRPQWKFRSLQPLSAEELQRIVASLRYGDTQLGELEVVRREPFNDQGAELVTLLDGRRIDGEGIDALQPREYLLLRKQVPGFGLYVSVLAGLDAVQRQMIAALLLVGFSTAALGLLVAFLMARRRIHNERARFRQREIAALEANEARVSAIIDNTQAGLALLDERGVIESFNPTAETLFGYRLEEISGRYFSQLLAEEDRPLCWRHILAQDPDAPDQLTVEVDARCQDGRRVPIELSLNRITLAGGQHFIATLHDLTLQKEQERQLKTAQEVLETRVQERTADLSRTNTRLLEEMAQHRATQNELIQTAKLAVIGQMSAGINHELNQPLTAIRNYADNAGAFLERGNLERAQANLQEISGLTEWMRKIIHPLKEFARKSSGNSEAVSLQAVRDGAMSLMYGRFEKAGVEVHWPTELARYFVLGDILRIEQVLVNLLANALQAMESSPLKRIEVAVAEQADWVQLSVRDTGPGIPEADLERVFEPFFTTKQSGQGLGLGLSISHRIIDTLGGRLAVSNHPDGGALFTIELPRASDPQLTISPSNTVENPHEQ